MAESFNNQFCFILKKCYISICVNTYQWLYAKSWGLKSTDI